MSANYCDLEWLYMLNICTVISMYVKYVNQYKDSFVEKIMNEQLGKPVSDPMVS